MSSPPIVRFALAALCLYGLPRCHSTQSAPEPPAAPASTPRLTPAFDVSGVVQSVRRRFRSTPEGFENGDASWRATVSATGRLALQPHPVAPRDASGPGGALELETTRVERGGRPLHRPPHTSVNEQGALSIDRGEAVESLVHGDAGLEQRWTFAKRPEGSGALRVLVAVAGQDFRGTSEEGLHFVDARSGLGVRYGLATWVDAAGVRTPLTPRFEAGHIVLEVPSGVVERSRYPAVLDPVLSPEQGIDDPIVVPASYNQETPALATDGTNFLLVWENAPGDILGTRVGPDGKVLDPYGITIASQTYYTKSAPAVAFNGAHYLVVWQDRQNGSSYNDNIAGARVSTAGVVLDTTARLISTAAGDQQAPAVASDGTDFLVVWEDRRISANADDIYGTRVLANGTVSNPTGVAYAPLTGEQTRPALAFNGTAYLVAWEDSSSGSIHIQGARVARDGTLLSAKPGIALATGPYEQARPAIASDGTRWLVAWQEYRSSYSDQQVRGTFVAPDGTVLDPASRALVSSAYTTNPRIRLAFDGTNYLMAWVAQGSSSDPWAGDDIFAARVGPDGTVLDPAGIALTTAPSSQSEPALATTRTGALVAWQSQTGYSSEPVDIVGGRLRPDGTAPDATTPLLLSSEFNQQHSPAVGFDGTNYLIAWIESRTANEQLLFTRVTPEGTVLDSGQVRLDTPVGGGYNPNHPAIAFNGSHYLVVWHGFDYAAGRWVVLGARIRPDGTVLDTPERKLATIQSAFLLDAPSVATDGTDFLVAWTDRRIAPYYDEDIYAVRILADGSRDPAGDIALCTATGKQNDPSIAFDGQRYVVAWQDTRRGTYNYDIYARPVTREGVALTEVLVDTASSYRPRVASNGQGSLIVWQDYGSGRYDVYGRTFEQDGGLGSSLIPISRRTWDQDEVQVAFDGTHYVVVWEDGRNDSPSYEDFNVYMARVGPDGTLVDDGGIPVSASPYQERTPALATNGDGGTLIAYVRADQVSAYEPARVKFRLGTERELGASCTTSGDCRSGFCADGVCCDSACGGDNTGDCQACGVSAGATEEGHCALLPANQLCRAARSASCDTEERCDGVSPECPADEMADAGTPCSDGNACSLGDSCSGGYCWNYDYVTCTASDSCHQAGGCSPDTGLCTQTPRPDGTPCGPGQWCTGGVCGSADAGVDGGTGDGGTRDGGQDAGTSDGGWDAGHPSSDGGSTPDAGTPSTDGGSTPPPAQGNTGGCGCGTASAHAPLALAALALLGVLSRAPRRRRPA